MQSAVTPPEFRLQEKGPGEGMRVRVYGQWTQQRNHIKVMAMIEILIMCFFCTMMNNQQLFEWIGI
jgi:hypothetical protein